MWSYWAFLTLVLFSTQAQSMPTRAGRMGIPGSAGRMGMPDPPATHMAPRFSPRGPVLPSRNTMPKMNPMMSSMAAGFFLGNDHAKRMAVTSSMNNPCVASRPYLKAILLDYMDAPPAALIQGAGMNTQQALGFQHLSDNMKRMNMFQELKSPCLNNYPSLKMLLSDIVDINPLMGMGAFSRGR